MTRSEAHREIAKKGDVLEWAKSEQARLGPIILTLEQDGTCTAQIGKGRGAAKAVSVNPTEALALALEKSRA